MPNDMPNSMIVRARAVRAKAGVSVGSLYQYFPNKEAVALAAIGSISPGVPRDVVPGREAFSRSLIGL